MGININTADTHKNLPDQSRGTACCARKHPERQKPTTITKTPSTHPNDVAAQHAVPVQQCNGKHAARDIENVKTMRRWTGRSMLRPYLGE